MSVPKKLFGIFLIFSSFLLIVAIGMPQIYANDTSGRVDKEIPVQLSFLQEERAPVIMLYLGYVGCETICTPAMTELSRIYSQLREKDVHVYFVNLLDKYRTDQDLPNRFAQHFNKAFKGVYLTDHQIQDVIQQLPVIRTNSLTDNYEMNHSGYLYILTKETHSPQYRLKYIYTSRPFSEQTIVTDIEKITTLRSNV